MDSQDQLSVEPKFRKWFDTQFIIARKKSVEVETSVENDFIWPSDGKPMI